MFRWACLAVAVVALVGFGWLSYDLARELKDASRATAAASREVEQLARTLNSDLPAILQETKKSAEFLAQVSQGVQRDLKAAGLTPSPGEESLVSYADSVLEFIEKSGGRVGLKWGKGLAPVHEPAKQWGAAQRPRAFATAKLSTSKGDFLDKFCLLSAIQVGDGESVPLREWLLANHEGSKGLK